LLSDNLIQAPLPLYLHFLKITLKISISFIKINNLVLIRKSFHQELVSERKSPAEYSPAFMLLGRLQKMRVLIVEQEKTLLQSLCYFMGEHKNFDVSPAHGLREGMILWQDAPFDLILCADRLPDGDGLAMLKKIISGNPQVISILMTTQRDEHLRQEALAAGVRWYLEKPFDLKQLEEAMGVLLPSL
jgi:CheY-like chemotaxis protein